MKRSASIWFCNIICGCKDFLVSIACTPSQYRVSQQAQYKNGYFLKWCSFGDKWWYFGNKYTQQSGCSLKDYRWLNRIHNVGVSKRIYAGQFWHERVNFLSLSKLSKWNQQQVDAKKRAGAERWNRIKWLTEIAKAICDSVARCWYLCVLFQYCIKFKQKLLKNICYIYYLLRY